MKSNMNYLRVISKRGVKPRITRRANTAFGVSEMLNQNRSRRLGENLCRNKQTNSEEKFLIHNISFDFRRTQFKFLTCISQTILKKKTKLKLKN